MLKIAITDTETKDVLKNGVVKDNLKIPRAFLKLCYENDVLPIPLPYLASSQVLKRVLTAIDGVIISGGADVNPHLYHEKNYAAHISSTSWQRDQLEKQVVKMAQELKKPILGTCRGMQIINVSCGGTLYQDLDYQLPNRKSRIEHIQTKAPDMPSHLIKIARTSKLYQTIGHSTLAVNSFHHQAVKKLGQGLKISAIAPDGVIEGLESINGLIEATQWHPEEMASNNPLQMKIFRDFFACSAQAAQMNQYQINIG